MNQLDKENSSEKIMLSKIAPIEGTPFATAIRKENEYVIVMGNHLVTNEIFYSRGAAIKSLEKLDYWVLLNIIGIYIDGIEKTKNLKNQN